MVIHEMSSSNISVFFCILGVSFIALADAPQPPWASEAELGFQRLKGNANSMAVNARLATKYINDNYIHGSEARFLLVETDEVQDKHQSVLESQANYKFDDKSYVLANLSYLADKYGAYFKDVTFSVGLGYMPAWSDEIRWRLEIGPGFHYQRPNLDEIGDDDLILPHDVKEPIMRAQSVLTWDISDSATTEGRFIVISGKSNTTLESRGSIETDILDTFAIKFSSTLRFIDKVPPGMKNKDSILNVNLLYRF